MSHPVNVTDLLRDAKVVLLIDWPSRDVPDALARGGLEVISDEGPHRGYHVYRADGDQVGPTPASRAPERADIVYAHRPLDELPDIVERARALGARAIWYQSGLDSTGERDPRGCWQLPDELAEARQVVESAGLAFVREPYIADVARETSVGHDVRREFAFDRGLLEVPDDFEMTETQPE